MQRLGNDSFYFTTWIGKYEIVERRISYRDGVLDFVWIIFSSIDLFNND